MSILENENKELKEKVERYEAALKIYADKDIYDYRDLSHLAREALGNK